MPTASPLPRKWLSRIYESTVDLRMIAHNARKAREQLKCVSGRTAPVLSLLQEIETSAYRLALELSEIEVATHCDECPAAPAMTSLQAHLLVMAKDLERHAEMARRQVAQPNSQTIQ